MKFLKASKREWHCVREVSKEGILAQPKPQSHRRCLFVRVVDCKGRELLEFQTGILGE